LDELQQIVHFSQLLRILVDIVVPEYTSKILNFKQSNIQISKIAVTRKNKSDIVMILGSRFYIKKNIKMTTSFRLSYKFIQFKTLQSFLLTG